MRHGSLFSGIGGFDLAAEWMGWENVFHCEWNEFGQKVLKYYWPQAVSYGDITKTDFTIWRGGIDILTGGFPCQPYSTAGKRKGKDDDRHLWPEMLRCIRECQPRWIVGENVYGLVNWNGGMVFDEVCANLEGEGYEVQPVIIPACAVNAPHRRDRVWFVAHAKKGRKAVFCDPKKRGQQIQSQHNPNGCGDARDAANADQIRLQREGKSAGMGWVGFSQHNTQTDKPAWEDFPTQPPVRSRNDGLSPELVGITVPKHRNESIKAYGNAIVPQVAYEIFKVIQKMEDDNLAL